MGIDEEPKTDAELIERLFVLYAAGDHSGGARDDFWDTVSSHIGWILDLAKRGAKRNAKIESDAKVIAALREALKDCADDLAEEVEARYIGFKEHPAMTPKYYRDMASVYAARDLLAANEQNVGERS